MQMLKHVSWVWSGAALHLWTEPVVTNPLGYKESAAEPADSAAEGSSW